MYSATQFSSILEGLAGVDLSEPLDDAVIAEIRRALLDHQVIFSRDQHLTPVQHLAFGRRFGSLNVHAFVGGMVGYPEIIEVRKGGRGSRQQFRGRLALRRHLP
jgi:taurine dioxygenase